MRRRTLAVAAVCLGGLLAVRLWVLEPITVSSGSMEPTIPAGGVVWLNKAAPHLAGIRPGQLVVFREPDAGVLIKRVVAHGGQTVSILDGLLYIDGRPATEPYVDQRTVNGVYFGMVTVPAGERFVLGDNRETSIDSRGFGTIAASDVLGTLLGTG